MTCQPQAQNDGLTEALDESDLSDEQEDRTETWTALVSGWNRLLPNDPEIEVLIVSVS